MIRLKQVLLGAALLTAALGAQAEELIVSAAASLTNAFREVGAAFEKTQPGVKVTFNFAASGPLLQQIDAGAPVDVFASADQETVDRAAAKNLIVPASRRSFVSNKLVLVQPREAAPVKALAELKDARIKRIGIGNPASVPVGRYTRDVLQGEGLWEPLAPRFINADSVRQVLDYVVRGEVDAGFVYATDAALAKDKVTVALGVSTVKPVLYPAAVVAGTKQRTRAEAFVAFLGTPAAQAVFEKYGFGKP